MESATNDKAMAAAADAGAADKGEVTASASSDSLKVTLTPAEEEEKRKQEEQWRADLARLEYEIQTLRNVLIAKMNEASELKRKLGITPMVELKQDLVSGFHTIRDSEPVKKTNAAIKSFGDFASRKIGDLRNSNTFKSVEEKVGVAYSNVKKRVSVSGAQSPTQEPTSPTFDSAASDGEELANMLPESGKSGAAASVSAADVPAKN